MNVLYFYAAAIMVLVGCGPASSPAYPSDNAYPSDRAASIQNLEFPRTIPTPSITSGVVFGKIESSAAGQSLGGLSLYLGTVLPLNNGPEHLINVSPDQSAKTTIYSDGRFLISDVTPGQYVLVLWGPRESTFAQDPLDPQRELVVNIVAGQIVDVGALTINPPR